jgi:hypothetical protein
LALTPPDPYSIPYYISLVLWVVLGIAWLMRFFVCFSTAFDKPSWRWQWLAYPVLALLMVVLASFQVPFRLTYSLSRGAMNEAARDVVAGKRDPAKIHWIGLYPVSWAADYGPNFAFTVDGTAAGIGCPDEGFNDAVFFYGANPESAKNWDPEYPPDHLSGHWYTTKNSCGTGG